MKIYSVEIILRQICSVRFSKISAVFCENENLGVYTEWKGHYTGIYAVKFFFHYTVDLKNPNLHKWQNAPKKVL
jgi:hypothetical protein